jgi:2,5-diamino-6-(ribosylamino)-4(3H)-pyrimidinone 5'-phosphate reductase
VIVHAAVSLDGKIDGFEPDVGVYYDLIASWEEDATLCGSETILAAAPDPDPPDASPVAEPEDDHRPLLAVVDSRGRVRSWSSLLHAGHWSKGLAFCSAMAPPHHLEYLARVGVETAIGGDDRVDLGWALDELAGRGIATVRIDAGPTLNGLALRAGLVDELSLLVHPTIAAEGRPFADRLETAARLGLVAEERRGNGLVWLRYRVEN